ncbi:hypothetical protein [Neisseria musculi]|uniref:Uncharacterized protein n=1 Tax=Neisseria musculi TaxID=1815583 RepID=A0A7H1M9Q3_9NEIS|nr:hypothetical protein [Neisseria musculi]QNT58368.1 hypothetical protein H7A79_1144 [Neisseria musculi]
MSFYRRNQDWQAYGQHRRRAWTRQARKKQETAEEYQARMMRETEELLKKERKK